MQRTRTTGDPRRGHYLLAVPPSRRIGNALGKLRADGTKWGEVRGANGIVVTAPTRHENADKGGLYHWVRTGPIPWLPAKLAEALEDADASEIGVTPEQVAAFMAGTAELAPNPAGLDYVMEDFARRAASGSRHDSALIAACWIARDAAAGLYPAQPALATLRSGFEALIGTDRPRHVLAAEWQRIASWAIGQLDPERVAEHRTKLVTKGLLAMDDGRGALDFDAADDEPVRPRGADAAFADDDWDDYTPAKFRHDDADNEDDDELDDDADEDAAPKPATKRGKGRPRSKESRITVRTGAAVRCPQCGAPEGAPCRAGTRGDDVNRLPVVDYNLPRTRVLENDRRDRVAMLARRQPRRGRGR